jgi:hypothetical protein
MKQLTLQEQYNLIKEGKGHKDVFLKTAKSQFPNIVPNAATFEQTSALLKQRSIISENIWGVTTGRATQPDWFSIFNENVNENYVVSSQEEPVKNSDKKISKQVEEDQEHNFDYKDPKNRDNVYGQDFLVGYYAEMKDPKNSEKTVDELLELVSKNLAKDRLHYVKDGQFGVKGLGYTEDAPGLGAGKEAKGKYKSSGYGDLKENKNKNNMIKLMNLLEREYYMPETKTPKKKEEPKKKVKKSPVSDRVKEIEEESMLNAMEGKIQAIAEEIEMRENKLAMIDENEDLQEFINPVRIKEMKKEIDELKKTKEKMEKEFEKKSKGKKPKEVIDEVENGSGIIIDGKKVKYSSIELEDVDPRDRPDYSDAYASYAEFEDGTELEDYQLEELTYDYPDVINDIANNQ